MKRAYEVGVKQQSAELDREMTPEWFAIWTRSRHEKMVRDQLAQKDVEVFLPTITKWSRWKDRKKAIDWPLFPGYCFARFDREDRLPVLKVEGVVSIVGTDGLPSPIPAIEIDSIRLLIESELPSIRARSSRKA